MAKQFNDNKVYLTDYTLPVAKGGLGHIFPYDPAYPSVITTYLTNASKNLPNGIAGLDASAKIPLSLINDPTTFKHVSLSGSVQGYADKSMVYTINDYNAFMTYTITVSLGSFTQSAATITYYPPPYACDVTFTINGRSFVLTIKDNEPVKPEIVSPYNNYNNHPNVLGVYTTAFVNGGVTAYTHHSSDWQLATDVNFTTLIANISTDTTNKVAWTRESLVANTTYYIRTRHRNSLLRVSPWSDTVKFTTRANFLNLTQEAQLTASDKAANDKFGFCVSADITGTRAVAGAVGKTGTFAAQGAAYVFLRTGTTWAQEAKLLASDPAASAQFGFSIDMSRDGLRVAVGSNQRQVTSTNNGTVYIFKRTGTTWAQEAKINQTDTQVNAYFGQSICFNGDGSRLVVGAYGANITGTNNSGCGYIFVNTGNGNWVQEAKLQPSQAVAADRTGWSVTMSYDGTRVALGSPFKTIGTSNGAAYVFLLYNGTWTQEALLLPDVTQLNAYFGYDVFMSDDGARLVVSSYGKNERFTGQGAVYVFERSGNYWTQEVKLTSLDSNASDNFGFSISANSDCTRVSVGAHLKTSAGLSQTGISYLYEKVNDTWKETTRLNAVNRAGSDWFGYDVDSTRDGLRLLVGAPQSNPGALNDAGTVYVYS